MKCIICNREFTSKGKFRRKISLPVRRRGCKTCSHDCSKEYTKELRRLQNEKKRVHTKNNCKEVLKNGI